MIYVHVPFCRSFCTYCDFYSELCPGDVSQQVRKRVFDDYVDGVIDEISFRLPAVRPSRGSGDIRVAEQGLIQDPTEAERRQSHSGTGQLQTATGREQLQTVTGPGQLQASTERGLGDSQRVVTAPETLYFGGGTPSVLPLEAIERIVKALGEKRYEEFTIEVNPDDITEKGVDYIRGLIGLGVNRVSMGVQSFDDSILRWMNRRHDAQGARKAVEIIREGGVRNLSIDLIFGLSQLTEENWRLTISEALSLKPEHISAYQLSIEEGSALGMLVREGKYQEASEEQCRKQYDILCEELKRAGFVHYEISNWARPGCEALHNSAYWRRVPYIGLGPGAHSLGYAADVSILSPGYANPSAHSPYGNTTLADKAPVERPGAKGAAGIGRGSARRGAAPAGTLHGSVPTVRSWNSETPARRLPDGSLLRWSRDGETLSAGEVSEETVMLALRTAAGISEAALRQLAGSAAVDALLAEGSLVQCIKQAVEAGESRLRIPEDRFFVSDAIIAQLLA